MKISIVVPIYNEEGNVGELHKQILTSCKNLKARKKISGFEIIFINDGSKDNSMVEMRSLKPLKIINFRKNYGQTAAMDAGFKESAGDVIITMDGDLQNNPKDVEALIDKINEGYDVVSGWRFKRKDKAFRMFLSKVANKIRARMLDDEIHDTGCSLKAYKRQCFEEVDLQGEMHRFIPAILKWHGFRVGEVKVDHRPRVHGVSKYGNWKRMIKVAVDMISIWFWRKYSSRPLHVFGTGGILMFLLGLVLFSFNVFDRLVIGQDLSDSAFYITSLFCCLTGVILFCSGMIADICVKTYYKTHKKMPYGIREIIDNA